MYTIYIEFYSNFLSKDTVKLTRPNKTDDGAYGGSQTSGGASKHGGTYSGSYGQGGSGTTADGWGGGGGGGYYGGGSAPWYGGAGGSGYIGGVDDGSTQKATQNGARSGNGYAKITFCDGVIC